MEKYSVLMSVYAGEKPEYLDQSLASMINQTVKADEIVLVKDGSLNKGLDEVIKKTFKNCYTALQPWPGQCIKSWTESSSK